MIGCQLLRYFKYITVCAKNDTQIYKHFSSSGLLKSTAPRSGSSSSDQNIDLLVLQNTVRNKGLPFEQVRVYLERRVQQYGQ